MFVLTSSTLIVPQPIRYAYSLIPKGRFRRKRRAIKARELAQQTRFFANLDPLEFSGFFTTSQRWRKVEPVRLPGSGIDRVPEPS